MKPDDQDDPLLMLNRLRRLPSPAPDPARAARVVDRCHRHLARQQRRRLQHRRLLPRIPEPAVVGGFALTYVVAVVHSVLRWRGLD